VEENTNDMIKEVMTSDRDGSLVVVKFMAFDGKWTYIMEDDEETSKFHYSPTRGVGLGHYELVSTGSGDDTTLFPGFRGLTDLPRIW
jgi:serine protease inhibitor